ncbi:MAG: HD domain-containing protein [Planctomycetia bacterium]|nr:HD domain-containing protein [Planctomycetia bacterium]
MTLTTQAREVIARGRQVLSQLRELGSAYDSTDESNPLTVFYDDTVSMMDTAMRTVALLPQAASGQSYICRGLDVMLTEIYDRLRTLEIGHERRRRRIQDIGTLGEILSELQTNQTIHTVDLERFAERIIEQVELGHPIDFIHESPEYPQAFAAAHGLTTAQVMARLVKFDPEMRMHSVSAIVASLVHDVGMLSVPPEVLMTSGSLEGEARRKVESHTTTGARWVLPLFRDAPWLVEAVAGHHERLDGSGYPDGAKGDNVKPFTRLLAVCDVYAAMMVPRPHRPARSSRTALADTLMMADLK